MLTQTHTQGTNSFEFVIHPDIFESVFWTYTAEGVFWTETVEGTICMFTMAFKGGGPPTDTTRQQHPVSPIPLGGGGGGQTPQGSITVALLDLTSEWQTGQEWRGRWLQQR